MPPTRKGSKRAGERGKIIATRSDDRTQLKDLGITKNQSSEWQRMAKDPDAFASTRKERVIPDVEQLQAEIEAAFGDE